MGAVMGTFSSLQTKQRRPSKEQHSGQIVKQAEWAGEWGSRPRTTCSATQPKPKALVPHTL
ncbi:Kv channel-interacting protein 1, isoform CRA_a [Mus musculus]|nr:Kv channel-interacting protein 1, isoform CRA_a [Mus musculus]